MCHATTASAACGGFGFALNSAATFEFAPAVHEVPSTPAFLVLNSRPLGIVVWHRNTINRLIGRQAWAGLDLVWVIHLRKAAVPVALLRLVDRFTNYMKSPFSRMRCTEVWLQQLFSCISLLIFSPGFAERSSQKLQSRLTANRHE